MLKIMLPLYTEIFPMAESINFTSILKRKKNVSLLLLRCKPIKRIFYKEMFFAPVYTSLSDKDCLCVGILSSNYFEYVVCCMKRCIKLYKDMHPYLTNDNKTQWSYLTEFTCAVMLPSLTPTFAREEIF